MKLHLKGSNYASSYHSYYHYGKVGVFSGVGYRYYVLDNNLSMNRWYIGPYAKYSLFNFIITDGYGVLESQKGTHNSFYGAFIMGWQHWFSRNFALDLYGGIGISQETKISYNSVQSFDYDSGIYSYSWDRDTQIGRRLLFTGGVKISIGIKTGNK